MELNDAVSRKIWTGSIPVAFRLSEDELHGDISSTLPPFYVSACYAISFCLEFQRYQPICFSYKSRELLIFLLFWKDLFDHCKFIINLCY